VWFTTNGMCVKNNTIMYVARTSNNRVIPMEWSWWVTSNNACEPGEQLMVLANGDDESDLVGWSLLLLAATVRSFAHMPLGISDRNTSSGVGAQCKWDRWVIVSCCNGLGNNTGWKTLVWNLFSPYRKKKFP